MSDHEPQRFGAELRRWRQAACFSLAALARHTHFSKGHLSKVENGQRGPTPDLARRCDAVLHADGALARLVTTTPTASAHADTPDSDDQWTISVDGAGQGGFGAITNRSSQRVGSVSPLSWAMPPGIRPDVDDGAGVSTFRTIFDNLRRAGHAMPPAALLPVVITHTHAMRLLASASAAPVRLDALVLAGRFAEYTGWLAQEVGDDRGALWWTDRAVEFAAAGADREIAAYALVRRGLVALYRYDAHETIAVAQQAQTLKGGARVRGLAALREAQGHALAGDYNQCRRLLDRGTVLLDQAQGVDDARPVLGSTTITDPVALVTGWCLHDLGRPQQAVDLLGDQFASVPAYAHRTRARVGVRYSLALVAGGEVEHGLEVIGTVLDSTAIVDSATVRVDLRRLAQELSRWRGHRMVKRLMPRLISALNTGYR